MTTPYGVALDNRGAKGIPLVYWYSAVSSAFRIVGYLAGYLTWLFSCSLAKKKIRDAGCEIHIKKFLKETKMTITIHYHGNLLL